MPMRPRSGRHFDVRHRKSWSSSSADGALKEKTWQPCGLTPDITCLIVPSLPAASIAWKISSTRPAVLGVELLLQLGQTGDVFRERGPGLLLLETEGVLRVDAAQLEALAGGEAQRESIRRSMLSWFDFAIDIPAFSPSGLRLRTIAGSIDRDTPSNRVVTGWRA